MVQASPALQNGGGVRASKALVADQPMAPSNNLGLDAPKSPSSAMTKNSEGRSHLSSQRTPKIRKVNGYIIFYDEVIGQGQFGTVVKA